MKSIQTCVIIGGGAAGFFAAIACAEANPDLRVILLEKTRQVLAKVRISGGGRCNVTHCCFDPSQLIRCYPRGGKELRGAFSRFQPKDTIEWFQSRGVQLKTESDGRMFPTTDNSETIIACLNEQARLHKVEICTEMGVIGCEFIQNQFVLSLTGDRSLTCDKLLIATGGAHKLTSMLENFGHKMIPPVPSLFTFNVPTSPLLPLSGLSVENVRVSLEETKLIQEGPLLLTHWGFSGPAVLKLSAWGARELHQKNYKAKIKINWLPHLSEQELLSLFNDLRQKYTARFVSGEAISPLPKNLWKKFLEIAEIPQDLRFAYLAKEQIKRLMSVLQNNIYEVDGKSIHKEEFVTCGGIDLSEINFKTMESRLVPNLYFAGEVLNIDGVTGGFNFQNAWTTGWLAGTAMGSDFQA